MTVKKRDTVGKIATELQKKEPDTRDPIELQRGMTKDFEKNLIDCIESGKNKFESPYYIEVLVKKERLLQNVIRNYFVARQSCPTPFYDQFVFQVDIKDMVVNFFWAIPDIETCQTMKQFALEVVPEERQLRDYVLAFYDGSLLKLCQSLNGELNEVNHDRICTGTGCIHSN